MKNYVTPKVELVSLDNVDIITSSGGIELPEVPITGGGIELPEVPIFPKDLPSF